jgi:hypothetical protein
LAWLTEARRLAAAAHERAHEVSTAVNWHAATTAAIERLDAEVRADFSRWIAFGSEGEPPSNQSDERSRLCGELTGVAAVAGLDAAAKFESDVADAVVVALVDMAADLRLKVLIAACQPVEDRIHFLAGELSAAYAKLAALGEVAGRSWLMPRAEKVRLPPLRHEGRPLTLEISANAKDEAAWRESLASLEANPSAVIAAPGATIPTSTPPRTRRGWAPFGRS